MFTEKWRGISTEHGNKTIQMRYCTTVKITSSFTLPCEILCSQGQYYLSANFFFLTKISWWRSYLILILTFTTTAFWTVHLTFLSPLPINICKPGWSQVGPAFNLFLLLWLAPGGLQNLPTDCSIPCSLSVCSQAKSCPFLNAVHPLI